MYYILDILEICTESEYGHIIYTFDVFKLNNDNQTLLQCLHLFLVHVLFISFLSCYITSQVLVSFTFSLLSSYL